MMSTVVSALYDTFLLMCAIAIVITGFATWTEGIYRAAQQPSHGPEDDPAALARIGLLAAPRPPDTDAA